METEKNAVKRVPGRAGFKNEMKIEFDAVSENEAFARVAVASFVAPLNPTVEEISDIKTAVSAERAMPITKKKYLIKISGIDMGLL